MRSRVLKWLLLGLAALIALLVIAALLLAWFVDPNRFKGKIEAAVRDATGRELSLTGDIELGFFPWLSLTTGEGRFGNAAGFGPEPMVSWQRAELGARLIPLLRGRVIADEVRIEGADIRLVRRADGSANWEGIGPREPTPAPAKPADDALELRIAGVRIANSRILFVDEGVPRRMEVSAFNFSTEDIELGKPLIDTEVSGVLRMAGFAEAGLPFRLVLPRAELPADFSRVDLPAFELELGGFAARGAVRGSLGDPLDLAGDLESNRFDPRALLAAAGVSLPRTQDEQALGLLQLALSWKLQGQAWAIEPLSLTLDDTRLSGHVRQGAGEAVGEFALQGDAIDLGRYVPPEDPASEPFVLPTAALRALQFRGVLQFEQVNYDDVLMKGVTLRLVLDEKGLRQAQPASAP